MLPISVFLMVMAIPVMIMPLIVVVCSHVAIFCYSGNGGRAHYIGASYSNSVLPVSVVLAILTLPVIILPLVIIVYN